MAKFHISTVGVVSECKATQGRCPYGDADEHFTSKEAARQANERRLEAVYQWSTTQRKALPSEAEALMKELHKLESNPALQNYGFPEDEYTRGLIHDSISEKLAKLNELNDQLHFVYLSTYPTSEDKEKALAEIATRVATEPEYAWKNVMGDKRRVTSAKARYESTLRYIVSQKKEHQDEIQSKAEGFARQNAFARAFDAKAVIPPAFNDAFEEAWMNGGETRCRKELELAAKNQATPSQVASLKRELKTRGRSNLETVKKVTAKIHKNDKFNKLGVK